MAITGSIAAVAALGSTIYQGQKGIAQQRTAIRSQEAAQKQAESVAQKQMRDNAEALRKANQKQPDISSILGDAQGAGRQGLGSTLLTGAGGVNPSSLNLGRTSLLGS